MHRDREELRRFYIENIMPKKDDIYRIVCSAVPIDVAEDITQEVVGEYTYTQGPRQVLAMGGSDHRQ